VSAVMACALGQLTRCSARGVPKAYADALAGEIARMRAVVVDRDNEPTSARLLTRAGNRKRACIAADWFTRTRDYVYRYGGPFGA